MEREFLATSCSLVAIAVSRESEAVAQHRRSSGCFRRAKQQRRTNERRRGQGILRPTLLRSTGKPCSGGAELEIKLRVEWCCKPSFHKREQCRAYNSHRPLLVALR
jgi:hypothetical protein